jgi:hypothetical protein
VNSHHPERSHPIRFFTPTFLVGLILAAGTVDVVLPVVANVSIGESELIEPIEPPVGEYCRIRRDGLTDLCLALVADAPRPAEPRPSDRPAFLRHPPRPRLAMGAEHRSHLCRRSRSPGLHRG